MNGAVYLGALVVAALAASGCSPKVVLPETTVCHLNSDCDSPLICANGTCRSACQMQVDCPAGELCIPEGDAGARVCLLPSESSDGGDAGG
jgi:hypothetical protein